MWGTNVQGPYAFGTKQMWQNSGFLIVLQASTGKKLGKKARKIWQDSKNLILNIQLMPIYNVKTSFDDSNFWNTLFSKLMPIRFFRKLYNPYYHIVQHAYVLTSVNTLVQFQHVYDTHQTLVPKYLAQLIYAASQSNVWCIKFQSKNSTLLLLCLLRNFMHQTLHLKIVFFVCLFVFVDVEGKRNCSYCLKT